MNVPLKNAIMRKLALLAFVSMIPFFLQAQSENTKIKWYTFEQAIKLCEKAPKKLMVDVYTDWCGWCKKMDAETFSNAEIAKYVNEHFYAVKFNAEGDVEPGGINENFVVASIAMVFTSLATP